MLRVRFYRAKMTQKVFLFFTFLIISIASAKKGIRLNESSKKEVKRDITLFSSSETDRKLRSNSSKGKGGEKNRKGNHEKKVDENGREWIYIIIDDRSVIPTAPNPNKAPVKIPSRTTKTEPPQSAISFISTSSSSSSQTKTQSPSVSNKKNNNKKKPNKNNKNKQSSTKSPSKLSRSPTKNPENISKPPISADNNNNNNKRPNNNSPKIPPLPELIPGQEEVFCTTATFIAKKQLGNCIKSRYDSYGCSDKSCQNLICNEIGDTFCCQAKWDENCVDSAKLFCSNQNTNNNPNSISDCFSFSTVEGETGCTNIQCQRFVCSIDETCCSVTWGWECALKAMDFCCIEDFTR